MQTICSTIDNIACATTDTFLLFGDFNFPNLSWNTDDSNVPALRINYENSRITDNCRSLLDCIYSNGLSQINFIPNASDNILDLIIVSDEILHYCAPPVVSPFPMVAVDVHHPPVELHLTGAGNTARSWRSTAPNRESGTRNYRRTNFIRLAELLQSTDWSFLEGSPDVNSALELFNTTLLALISDCCPLMPPRRSPPWSDARLRRLKQNKASCFRFYSTNGTQHSKLRFIAAHNVYRSYNRQLHTRYLIRVKFSLIRHPTRFWRYVESKRGNSSLPDVLTYNNVSTSSKEGMCNLFADRFKDCFTTDDASLSLEAALNNVPRDVVDIDVRDIIISVDTVLRALQQVKTSYNPGPDGIPTAILAKCREFLAEPLSQIYQLSFAQSTVPTAWKSSVMFPVYKKGDKNSAENYRGITTLPSCAKVFEIVIQNWLMNHCRSYISTRQHGFFPRRSVTTNLVEFVSNCHAAFTSGAQMDAVYTDLKAAFDRVNHRLLLAKLARIGLSTPLVNWFRSYISERSYYVQIDGVSSNVFESSSGVPQGSNLGPLLFSLFINDITLAITEADCLLYADDVRLFRIVRNTSDSLSLQRSIDVFSDWCINNDLLISVDKCTSMSFFRIASPIRYIYSISGTQLPRCNTVRDLGVTLERKLDFRQHYCDILDKANKMLGFIRRHSRELNDPHCLLTLYKSYVRSILEFSSTVWCPFSSVWSNRIEAVQKRVTRIVLHFTPWRNVTPRPSYHTRCLLFGLDTLARRRDNAQCTFLSKLIVGEIDSPELLARVNINVPPRVFRNYRLIRTDLTRRAYSENDPMTAMARKFNQRYISFDWHLRRQNGRDRNTIGRDDAIHHFSPEPIHSAKRKYLIK
uniref:uncharacterized protein LOC125908418 n=1 Tax=Anopheles coluzzii TaxID=1518534 RepID=UPI0020FFB533|nr:uncharacterized protein LOC125908418 [Anopheles coluzzii]